MMDEFTERITLVFLGAVISWAINQYRLARSEDIALVNEHIKDIERLSEAAQCYWLKAPLSPENEFELSGKIRAAHAATTLLYGKITRICSTGSSVEYTSRYSDLFIAATGGSFESPSRTADPLRAIEVADISARVVHLLRLERSSIVSGSRAIGLFFSGCRNFLFPPASKKPWLRFGDT